MIFQPTGPQMEYAESRPGANDGLILNIYRGCNIGCTYCKAEEKEYRVKNNARFLELLEKQCKGMKGDPRPILVCFNCDPYPKRGPYIDMTRETLLVLEKYEMNVRLMTRNGMRACKDFDILKRNDWEFGQSFPSMNGKSLRKWEPNAATKDERMAAFIKAYQLKIRHWISVSPMWSMQEADAVVRAYQDSIDKWTFAFIFGRYPMPGTQNERKAWIEKVKRQLKGKNVTFRNS